MSTVVIKTIKGRRYRYLQRSYRDGGKVRTESLYLGPVDGGRRKGILRRVGELIAANRSEPGTRLINEMVENWEKQCKAQAATEKQAEDAFYERMHALYGTTKGAANPAPIEKVPASAGTTGTAATQAEDVAAGVGESLTGDAAGPEGAA